MRKKGIIGLKIGLFAPTMRIHPQTQPKAVPPLQLEIEGEVPTPPEVTACAQEAVCPVFGRYGK